MKCWKYNAKLLLWWFFSEYYLILNTSLFGLFESFDLVFWGQIFVFALYYFFEVYFQFLRLFGSKEQLSNIPIFFYFLQESSVSKAKRQSLTIKRGKSSLCENPNQIYKVDISVLSRFRLAPAI